jgi:uncharacterized membrane protein YfcA
MLLIYFIIALFATALGGMTGMGGGVIIKPVLDLLGHFDVASISALSSITVLVMAAVSLFLQRKSEEKPPRSIALPLSAAAALGGILGGSLLESLISGVAEKGLVIVAQNMILAVLIILVFINFQAKKKADPLRLEGVIPSAITGFALGLVSAFLGIGGGPINVPLIMLVFGFTAKTSAICSLCTILFSQAAKLLFAAISGSLAACRLSVLPVMLIGAVLGGFIGGKVLERLSDKTVIVLFNFAQFVVFSVCIINIFIIR